MLNRPTTSRSETPLHNDLADADLYQAEWQGRQYRANMNFEAYDNNNYNMVKDEDDVEDEIDVAAKACLDYTHGCPEGVISLISDWY